MTARGTRRPAGVEGPQALPVASQAPQGAGVVSDSLKRAVVPPVGISERRWLQQLIGTYTYRGLERAGGLFRMFGWGLVFHDEATNAPRACPHCKRPIRLPRNAPGFPDILAIRGDTLIVAELKSDRGSTTQDQRLWLAAFRGVRRITVEVWKPKDVERVVEALQ